MHDDRTMLRYDHLAGRTRKRMTRVFREPSNEFELWLDMTIVGARAQRLEVIKTRGIDSPNDRIAVDAFDITIAKLSAFDEARHGSRIKGHRQFTGIRGENGRESRAESYVVEDKSLEHQFNLLIARAHANDPGWMDKAEDLLGSSETANDLRTQDYETKELKTERDCRLSGSSGSRTSKTPNFAPLSPITNKKIERVTHHELDEFLSSVDSLLENCASRAR